MNVAVVGATGLVGREILTVLEESAFPTSRLLPVASPRSAGRTISFNGEALSVLSLKDALKEKIDLALFSAGGAASREYAPQFIKIGAVVVDNSSAWRMEEDVPLVVPEINMETAKHARLIANPNCSTIQLVMALSPLEKAFGIERAVVSTYQSVSGTGKAALEQLYAERNGKEAEAVYPHNIDLNCLPHCDVFLEDGATKEERKVVNETRKILGLPKLRVSCTAVRVPVVGGHSESVNLELKSTFTLEAVREALAAMPGVVVQDDPANNLYPMPAQAKGKDEVFVGRIRRDESVQNGLNLWIVADNLRKGAATNAVQIARALA